MRRREFIAALGGAVAWPIGTRAQQPGRTYRIAVLSQSSRNAPHFVAFLDELRLLGFIEGQNMDVVAGGFGVRAEQLAERVAEIISAAPDAIVAAGELATRAAQAATRTIPILGGAEDMVAAGLVESLARPGSNVTGFSILSPELDGKRQDILIEAVPGMQRVAALHDTFQAHAGTPQHIEALRSAARARGVEMSVFAVSRPEQIASAIADAKASGSQALNVLASPMLVSSSSRQVIFGLASAARLPAIYQWADLAEQGGLAAYGPRLTDLYRQQARRLARVLRGAKPADIPVEQPTSFELVINLRAAKTIGHEIPASLVLRADKVIE